VRLGRNLDKKNGVRSCIVSFEAVVFAAMVTVGKHEDDVEDDEKALMTVLRSEEEDNVGDAVKEQEEEAISSNGGKGIPSR
jgi:hypothetical protein